MGRDDRELVVRWGQDVAPNAVSEVASLGVSLIGDRHPDAATLDGRLAADPNCLLVVSPVAAPPTVIVAYSLVYALAPPATQRLLAGTIPGEAPITVTDLHPARATSVYVGMVAAADRPGARATALRALITHVLIRSAALPDAAWAFARAATPAGERLTRRTGFARIPGPAGLWVRSLATHEEVAPVAHRTLLGRDRVVSLLSALRAARPSL